MRRLYGFFCLALLGCNPSWAKTVEIKRSLYRNILVDRTGDVICLRFALRARDGQNQSCKDLEHPQHLVFDYARLAVGAIATVKQPRNMLMLGLGGGTLAEAAHQLFPAMHITAVEIDPAVVEITQRYFGVKPTGWLNISVMDGRVFVKRALRQTTRYDIIVLDAFNGDYIPAHLMTLEFLEDTKSLLTDNGMLMANTFSTSRLYDYESATYAKVFPGFKVLRGNQSGNRIILAHNPPKLEDLVQAAGRHRELFQRMGIKLPYLQRAFQDKPHWRPVNRLLTDDYSPVNLLKGSP